MARPREHRVFSPRPSPAGLVGRWRGKIKLIAPGEYDNVWLDLDPPSKTWRFLLRYAGKHFDANEAVIEDKGKVADLMSLALALAAVFGAAWAGAVFSGSSSG